MAQSAYIKFVKGSAVSSLTLEDLEQHLLSYKEQLARTGQQLGWSYENAGFPYSIEKKAEGGDRWFYLKGQDSSYRYIVLGLGKEAAEDGDVHYVQVVLPDDATHGDKGKANELCRHLGRKLQGELHMFNGRVMYFYPRK
ncbi:DUF1885 family protein [Paenibacillus senegalensis]|uniref:DUF1885 family protein n=1 Tax=Paenibacillus senegalensis TaxID=1465766 RepID=UPI000288A3B7|nr:DUF1885 family protein [Paenibacillus senegalensis]